MCWYVHYVTDVSDGVDWLNLFPLLNIVLHNFCLSSRSLGRLAFLVHRLVFSPDIM